jgi:hypothetical protein
LWATLFEETEKPESGNSGESLADVSVGEVTGFEPVVRVKAQLSWIEYFQGVWSGPNISGFMRPKKPGADLPDDYYVNLLEQSGSVDPAAMMVHASAEDDGSVWLHLTGDFEMAFRLVSRNSPATPQFPGSPLAPPYPTVTTAGHGRYAGDGSLSVRYVEKITTKNGTVTTSCPKTRSILGQGSEYSVVTHARQLDGLPADVGKLVLPFFYADEHHTFYVEPRLTEKTIQESDNHILVDSLLDLELNDDHWWEQMAVVSQVPVGPPLHDKISATARFSIKNHKDQSTKDGILFEYGGGHIGPGGGTVREDMR